MRTVTLYNRHVDVEDDMVVPDYITIGGVIYGQRWDKLILHESARRRIDDAVALLQWLRHFRCRFAPGSEGYQDLHDLDTLLIGSTHIAEEH